MASTPRAPETGSSAGDGNGSTSHDKLFKNAFRRFFRDLIELVHPELAEGLDLDHPRFLPPEVFADFRKAGHLEPDLVAEVAASEAGSRLVTLHVEIENRFTQEMDERVWLYNLHLRIDRKKPVLSYVVYLKGGTASLEVHELVESVGSFEVHRFHFVAFCLSQSLAEEYVRHPQPLAGALAALMRSEIWGRIEQKLECLRAIRRPPDLDLSQRYALGRIVDTYIRLDQGEAEAFAARLAEDENKEVREMVVTWEEALAEREARGQLEAAREADLRAARRRFGSLPAEFEDRLGDIDDLERLYEILDQVLEAESLDDIDLR
jgi:hypothetical protein